MNHLTFTEFSVYNQTNFLIMIPSVARITISNSLDIGDFRFNVIIGLLVSLIILIVGINFIQKRRKLLTTGIRVDGIVFSIVKSGIGPDYFFYPVVRFVTAVENEWITQQLNIGGQQGAYNEGDKVVVIYDPIQPTNFILDDWRSEYIGKIFACFGFLGILFCVVMMFW